MTNKLLALLVLAVPSFATASEPSIQSDIPTRSETHLSDEAPSALNWGIDGALFKSFSGESTLSSARLNARRLVSEVASFGIDVRHWGTGSYPLALDAGSGTWSAGLGGQLDLFRGRFAGAYLGGSFLWVPSAGQLAFAPEAGVKWYATHWLAIGLSYSVITDLSSSIVSFEPPVTGVSRQSLGLELSVYL